VVLLLIQMDGSTIVIGTAAGVALLLQLRAYIRQRRQERIEADAADRKYETRATFRSDAKRREGAEAIYRETGACWLVRVKCIDADGHTVEVSLERLDGAEGGTRSNSGFTVGASWECFGISDEHWSASPYPTWELAFDPELIKEFKRTLAETMPGSERRQALRTCYSAWQHNRIMRAREVTLGAQPQQP
jgi:hypothetical protein